MGSQERAKRVIDKQEHVFVSETPVVESSHGIVQVHPSLHKAKEVLPQQQSVIISEVQAEEPKPSNVKHRTPSQERAKKILSQQESIVIEEIKVHEVPKDLP